LTKRTMLPQGLGAVALLLLLTTQAAAEGSVERLDRAQALYRRGQYREALAEYQALYAERQAPHLLLEMARTHQRLGDVSQAIDLYRRYLAAETARAPALRAEAEQQMRRLSALGGASSSMAVVDDDTPAASPSMGVVDDDTRPVPLPIPIRSAPVERGRNIGLLASGASLLGTGYMAAFTCGIVFTASSASLPGGQGRDFATVTGVLMIPIAGPFLSGILAPLLGPKELALTWSLPWILVDGAGQIAGLAMTVVGARRRPVPLLTGDVRLGAMPLPGGGGLALTGRL
jgi:hypothetical protein